MLIEVFLDLKLMVVWASGVIQYILTLLIDVGLFFVDVWVDTEVLL